MSVLLKQRLPNSSLNRFSLYEINRVLLAASANVDRVIMVTLKLKNVELKKVLCHAQIKLLDYQDMNDMQNSS